MNAGKVTFVLLFAITLSQSVLTSAALVEDDSDEKVLRQVSNKALAAEKGKITNVRYEVCAVIGDTIYYCPGDTICCTPGSPDSKCCPEDHPLCIGDFCCPSGYPKVCGPYCCPSESFCCNDEYCCKNEQACCGVGQCCTDQTPCCKETGTESCCDKDTQACCDDYGCVEPCESQFDAIGCQFTTLSLNSTQEDKDILLTSGGKLFGTTLYRILRPDENCQPGLVAKNPQAKKTVLSHVNCGTRSNYKSQYISTSTSLDVMKYYKKMGEKKGLTGLRIAKLTALDKLPKVCKLKIVDLTIEANRDKYLGNAVCKNFAKKSCEVLLECNVPIPCEVIDKLADNNRKDPSEL